MNNRIKYKVNKRNHWNSWRNPTKKCFSPSTIYGKPSAKKIDSVADALQESPIDKTLHFKWKYLQYLHSLRNNLKKRIPSTNYFDIYEDLASLDKVMVFTQLFIINNSINNIYI